jgi:hypothetical protein
MLDFIRDFLRWRRLDRQERCVATDVYTTTFVNEDYEETGEIVTHVVEFWIDGTGKRWTVVETSDQYLAKEHNGITVAKSNWRHHADLPPAAKRVSGGAPVALVVVERDAG